MNKNSRNLIVGIVIVIVIILIIWFVGRNQSSSVSSEVPGQTSGTSTPATPAIPVSETTKVSSSLSKFENSELGFSVQYPTAWQKGDVTGGVQFVIPIDQTQVSTVNRLEADITVVQGKCSFPPVTTVDSRGTLAVGSSNLNMISISNTVQGRSYFNRMYSLDKGGFCYFFSFSYVALSPDSKGLTGSNLTQAQNNNKAIKATADAAFTSMVKTLTFIASAVGQDETTASPAKK